jgi:twitching motility two-component system response regulator PilG
MSDLEALLAHRVPSPARVIAGIEKIENSREAGFLDSESLVNLAIGYLNVDDMPSAYDRLREASSINPNNVLISSHLNTLAIRMDEIRTRDERHPVVGAKTILVVDDSPTVLKLISGKLEKNGHEVFCSEDGLAAIELLQHLTPDLILLDINMPRMDGYQVCKQIRATERTKDIPVIMISGRDGFFDKVRGKMAGCTDYITKPFGPEALMKALETYLGQEAPVEV